MDNDDLEEGIDDLINQLKNNTKKIDNIQKKEEFTLDREDVEQFLINNAGKLIADSMDIVDSVKQYVAAAPNSDEVESLASLMKAATSSIDSLSKIFIQNTKSKTSIELKTLDIDSKKELLETDHQNKLELSREEVLERLIKSADIIEADTIEDKSSNDHDKD